MTTPPVLQDHPRRECAVIRLLIPKDQIAHVMGPAIGELVAAASSQEVLAGPVYSRHFRLDPEVWDLEVGVVVSAPVLPEGRVAPGELPACRAVGSVYTGPYEGLGDAWQEFSGRVAETEHTTTGEFWEEYRVGPESTPDPQRFQTSLHLVLAGA